MKLNKLVLCLLLLISGVRALSSTVYAADSTSSEVSVGFYVAEEDLGIQFKEDEEGSYIQNFENFTVKIEDNKGDVIVSDENVIHVNETSGLKITAMMVPSN